MKSPVVLSLFGGAEQGRAILDEMQITPAKYFSSEIDPYAIKLSSANFPDIVHIGSVTDISTSRNVVGNEGKLCIVTAENIYDTEIDLLIGGPPCQDLSIAGKRAGLDGEKSSLFYEYVRILNEVKPRAFFMENVASMPKEARETITKTLFGIEPIYIDSKLTSAQNRKRLYWMGVRQSDGTYKGIEVPQPEDKGILLKDILEDIPFDAVDKNGKPIWKPLPEKYIEQVEKRIAKGSMSVCNLNPSGKGMNGSVINPDGKCPTITTNKGEGIKIICSNKAHCVSAQYEKVGHGCEFKSRRSIVLGQFQIPHGNNTGGLRDSGKAQAVNANGDYVNNNKIVAQFRRGSSLRIHSEQDKVCTLTANMGTGGNNVPILIEGSYYWRKLIVRECARAQSFSESYSFDSVSDSRAYKAIGNSWEKYAAMHGIKYIIEAIS